MKQDVKFLKEKLIEHFDEVFETRLINEIAKNGQYATFKKRDILVDMDSEMTHIPLIIKGLVKILREDHHEEEILLYYLEEGDTCAISFVNCINQSKSMFRATVEEDVECIMFPVNKIEEWITKYKTWRVFLIDSYHTRLMEMTEAINSLAFLRLDNRLYKYLLKQVEIRNSKDLYITHQEIANDLHTSRVGISRLLKAFEHEGKIKLGRHKINISV